MNATVHDRLAHADFDACPGLFLEFPGIPLPACDQESIHSCPPIPSEGARGRQSGRKCHAFRRTAPPGAYSPQRETLTAAMKAQGWSYVSLGARLGIFNKTLWNHLTGRGHGWRRTFAAAAQVLGRPDLAEWVREPA